MKKKIIAKNAFYAQSGGVTAVINASACGLIETAKQHKTKISKVYAGKNGILGALTENLIDTSLESDKEKAALVAGQTFLLQISSKPACKHNAAIPLFCSCIT